MEPEWSFVLEAMTLAQLEEIRVAISVCSIVTIVYPLATDSLHACDNCDHEVRSNLQPTITISKRPTKSKLISRIKKRSGRC